MLDAVKEKVRLLSREEIVFSLPYGFYKTLDEDLRKGLDAEYWRRMDFASNPKAPRVHFQQKFRRQPNNVPATEKQG